MPRHPERSPARRRSSPAVPALLAGTMLLLAGCSAPQAPVTPSGSPSVTPPHASASAAPVDGAAPTFVAGGTAADNLPLFAATTDAVWASDGRASGRAYVDALVAVGFDKAAMEVTADTSTVGNAAESLMFSVRWGDECLVGQVGPATGDPIVVVVPALAEGTCLVGQTRPIDW